MSTGYRKELELLHRQLFRAEPSEKVLEMYEGAMASYESKLKASLQVDMATILDKSLDAEAIEVFLRVTRGRNSLTQRFQALFYLLETEKDYYKMFHSDDAVGFLAIPRLGLSVFRTAYKFLKGFLLVRAHSLVGEAG